MGLFGETSMSSLAAWMISLTLSLCAIILAAGANLPGIHMAASGIVSLVFALLAVREHNGLAKAGANRSALGSSTARYTGLVWAWGALGILVTYAFILDQRWPEWRTYVLGFIIAGAGCLLFGTMLNRDAEAGKEDDSFMQLGRTLVMIQLAAMVLAAVSLVVEGKFPRAANFPDWAACNIFFFGSIAIAAISLNALLSSRKK